MGFEAFSVILSPADSDDEGLTAQQIVSQMKRKWHNLHSDTLEPARRDFSPKRSAIFLVYEIAEGLIQAVVWTEKASCSVQVELRFAYCNPRSIYGPFCEMTAWLMQKYKMTCHIGPDLAPEQQDISDDFDNPEKVAAMLTPSMDYNRSLWQSDAGTLETAALRPGDAIAKFITPRLLKDGDEKPRVETV